MIYIDYNALFTPVITAPCVAQRKNAGLLIWVSMIQIMATTNFFFFHLKLSLPNILRLLFIFLLCSLYVFFFIKSVKRMALHIRV